MIQKSVQIETEDDQELAYSWIIKHITKPAAIIIYN